MEFFKKPEKKTYDILIDKRIIKAKGMLIDVDGFLFLYHFQHGTFNEAENAVDHIAVNKERFGNGRRISSRTKYMVRNRIVRNSNG